MAIYVFLKFTLQINHQRKLTMNYLRILFLVLLFSTGSSIVHAGWLPPFVVGQEGHDLRIAIDGEGTVWGVYVHEDIESTHIRAVQVINSSVVSEHTFPVNGLKSVLMPNIALNNAGNGVAAWYEFNFDESYYQVLTSILINGLWSDPFIITDHTVDDVFVDIMPGVTIDAQGNALVVWNEFNNIAQSNDIYSSKYSNGSWSAPAVISNSDSQFFPVLAGNEKGDAIVAWFDDDVEKLFLALYSNGAWGPAQTFPGATIRNICAQTPASVAINDSGVAYAAWIDENANVATIGYNNGTWGAVTVLSDENIGRGTTQSVGVDSSGAAFVLWSQANLDTTFAAIARRGFNNTWDPQVILEQSASGQEISDANIVADGTGNALALWVRYSLYPTGDVRSATFTQGNWSQAVTVGSALLRHGFRRGILDLAINSLGTIAAASWWDSDSLDLFVAFNTPLFGPQPPVAFSGVEVKNSFLTQTNYINVLSWQASPSPEVISYQLSRNGLLIATIPANAPLTFVDPNRVKNVSYLYSIVAIDNNGLQGAPAQIFVPQ